jgi:hypothetical protein
VYSDKTLSCADCSQEFVFTASEQDFYAQRGFTEPRRCPGCRASRKAAHNGRSGGWLRGCPAAAQAVRCGSATAAHADVHRDLQQLRSRRRGPFRPTSEARLQRLLRACGG